MRLREFCPDQPVQFLTVRYTDELPGLLAARGFDLDILYTELNEERVKALHAAGVRINVWTCDDSAAAEQLCAWGVDFITSNILE